MATASGARSLYTPAMLRAALALADYPLDPALPLRGDARSRTCGSTLTLGLALDPAGRVARVGLQASTCAVGQAAAHIFAAAVVGRSLPELAAARAALTAWLDRSGALPDWPGLDLIAAARDYPARHGAIVLVWDAALAALNPPVAA